jgi:hypothetical protein
VIGTLVGALAVRTQARDLLGPLISLPLLVPVRDRRRALRPRRCFDATRTRAASGAVAAGACAL